MPPAAQPVRLPVAQSAPPPPAGRRISMFVAGACLLVVLAILSLAAVQLLLARQNLLSGLNDLQTASKSIHSLSDVRNPLKRAALQSRFTRALGRFSSARSDLQLWSPFLPHLDWIPKVGGQLAAAPSAADAAFYTTRSASSLVSGTAPLWPLVDKHSQNTSILERIGPALQASNPAFRAARSDAQRAAGAAANLPVSTGNATLDRASARLQRDIPTLQAATAWLSVAPAVLGMSHPNTILLAWQNPTEIRATGGFIGAADLVTINRGAVSSHFTGSSLEHEVTSAIPPLPESQSSFEYLWLFRDSNWSPDFPLTARVERWFFGHDTNQWANSVVNVTDTIAPEILRATGPVYLPEYSRWVNAGNAEALAQQYVNGAYKGPSHAGSPDTVRKQFFGAIFRALVHRIQTLPSSRWPALGKALHGAIQRKDVMMYDRSPDVQSAIDSVNAGGSVLEPSVDSLFIVDDNRSYNKVGPYIQQSATYRATIRPDLWVDATLTIHYHLSHVPTLGEDAGPFLLRNGHQHDFQDFLRVYVPPGTVLKGMTGAERWAPQPAYGLTQLAGRFIVREGGSHTIIFHYLVPANVFAASDFGAYNLVVQRQPGTRLPGIDVTVRGAGGVILRSVAGHRVSRVRTALLLSTDAYLSVPVEGSIHPRTINLPPVPAVPDPYIPFQDFSDPHHPL